MTPPVTPTRAFEAAARRGRCAEPGPWGAACTDWPGHRYSHFDGSKDQSWQDDWREETPPEGGGTYEEEL